MPSHQPAQKTIGALPALRAQLRIDQGEFRRLCIKPDLTWYTSIWSSCGHDIPPNQLSMVPLQAVCCSNALELDSIATALWTLQLTITSTPSIGTVELISHGRTNESECSKRIQPPTTSIFRNGALKPKVTAAKESSSWFDRECSTLVVEVYCRYINYLSILPKNGQQPCPEKVRLVDF